MNTIYWFLTTHKIPYILCALPTFSFKSLNNRLYYLSINWNLEMLSNFPRSKTNNAELRLNSTILASKHPCSYPLIHTFVLFLMIELTTVSEFILRGGVENGNACIVKVIRVQNLEPSLNTSYMCLSFLWSFVINVIFCDPLLLMWYSKFFYN